MGAYAEAVERRNALLSERAEMEREFEQCRVAVERRIAREQEVSDVAEAGGPADAFTVACDLLSVRWARPRLSSGDVVTQFDAAIQDVQAGCPAMRREYFGIKRYAQWDSQASNHPYGYGPKHGEIWFSIGLKRRDVELSDDQRIACIQWLRALRENPELLP